MLPASSLKKYVTFSSNQGPIALTLQVGHAALTDKTHNTKLLIISSYIALSSD